MADAPGDRLGRFSRGCAALGVAVLFGCAAITVADIIGRRTVGLSLPGLIDLSQLLVMTAMFLCIPYAFRMRANVDVDLIHKRLPRFARRALDVLWSALSVAFLVAIVWHAGNAAIQVAEYGETSPTLALPMIGYWLPILFGCGLSAIICLRQAFSPPDDPSAPDAPAPSPGPVPAADPSVPPARRRAHAAERSRAELSRKPR